MNPESAPVIRVLIADDEPAARSALGEMLREEGYEVQTAADGYKALGKIDEWTPDVLITDVKMPALGGIELMQKLRERLPEVAIIVMTAFGSVEGAVEAMRLGADDYLPKPVHFPISWSSWSACSRAARSSTRTPPCAASSARAADSRASSARASPSASSSIDQPGRKRACLGADQR